MSRLWLELIESELTSGDEKRIFSAIRKIAEDDTGDATYIEQRLAEMLLSTHPHWISVKDRLPPQDERVLVWLWEKGEIDIDIIRREGKSDGGGLQFIGNYLHNITFWTPLPAPPNTKEKNKMRFEEKKDHYLDTKTGLKWSKKNFGPMSWEDAMTSLLEGWRLPTVEELLSIVDDAKHNPATELVDMVSSYYWSSTTNAYNPYDAWVVDFYYGLDGWYSKSNDGYVRAVRGS